MWLLSERVGDSDVSSVKFLSVSEGVSAFVSTSETVAFVHKLTMPFSFSMQRAASSSVLMVTKPKPRDRSDCRAVE